MCYFFARTRLWFNLYADTDTPTQHGDFLKLFLTWQYFRKDIFHCCRIPYYSLCKICRYYMEMKVNLDIRTVNF